MRARGSLSRSVLEVALDVEVDLLQLGEQLRVRLGPEPPVDRLVQPLDHALQRPRVGVREEVAVLLVEDVGLRELLIHPVGDDTRRRVEAEEVVDGGRQLERALVAVPSHRRDPAGVDDPRPEDA